jgi:hypothetical protein
MTPGELARRVGDALRQLEVLVKRVEDQYVRKEVLELYKETIDQAVQMQKDRVTGVREDLTKKLDKDDLLPLERRVAELEDTYKWAVRIVLLFVITGVLGAVFVAGGGMK